MKLKYYLRGLGIGIIVTTIILVSCFSMQKPEMTDADIIAKAEQLGMIMPGSDSADAVETETASTEEKEPEAEQQTEAPEETGQQTETTSEETRQQTETTSEETGQQAGTTEKASEETTQQTGTPEKTAEEAGQQTETTEKQEEPLQEDAQKNTESVEQIPQEPFTLVVKRGDVCRTVCENLAANGVIDDAEGLRKYINEAGYASFISAGTYQIPYHASYEEITGILKAGPMEQQKQ